ncbi:MAG: glycosyltransferase family 4 protein [Candidatus Acidiferrales bacterium]
MRTWSVLRALVEEGHEVTFIAFADRSETNGNVPELSRICRKVIFVPNDLRSLSSSGDYMRRIWQLRSRIPYGVALSQSPEMSAQVRGLLRSGEVDAVLCEQTDLAINLPATMPVPLIADFHNVDHLILERYLEFEGNPWKRLYVRTESRRVRDWERLVCQSAALALVCSAYDGDLLVRMCSATPIFVVPNVVDVNHYGSPDREDPFRIIFQGGMDWYPNRDAVEFFITSILPHVRQQVPAAQFCVAGRNPPPEFVQRFRNIPNVKFTGTVPDMRAEIVISAISVVPLRIGSGTRLKILEAAAMAKAIVSTRLGAEGLDFLNSREIVLEDDPKRFAEAVAALLGNQHRRRDIGVAARARVEKQYSFAALRQAIQTAMTSVVKAHECKDQSAAITN